METLDLACTSGAKIGLLGSIYFVGWAFAALILPRLSDIYGRKYLYLTAMTIQCTFWLVILFSRSLNLTIAMMFFFGMGSLGRSAIGFLYLMELLPQTKQTFVASILAIVKFQSTTFVALYFLYVSKYWFPLEAFMCGSNALICISILFLPESPKFLISKRRYEDARMALAYIAKLNRCSDVKTKEFKLDREVIE